ncbi:MAG: adenylyl-sulfate kinase, partial [Rhodospirillales bacterium]|nr:adenylyl-sulfate kinase [Rhodospirillales bacterium]
RNARLCKTLADQGVTVIIATISLFHEVQDWNRTNIGHYTEVFLRVSFQELKERDPKNLYVRASVGEEKDVYGFDLAPENPKNADIVIDNFGETSAEHAADMIFSYIEPHLT